MPRRAHWIDAPESRERQGVALADRCQVTSVGTVTREIIGSAIDVHKVLGPGLLESAYELALAIELGARGISFDRQVRCPVFYRGHCVGDYRLDLLVADLVPVEIKSVEIRPVFVAQMLTYLRACGRDAGLIINFNVPSLREGISRVTLRHSAGSGQGSELGPIDHTAS
jgi:GxxExxY protein